MTADERETVIQYDDRGELASVWTCHAGLAKQLQRRGLKPERTALQDNRIVSWLFMVPKVWVTVRPPRRSSGTGNLAALTRARQARLASKLSPGSRGLENKGADPI